MADKLKTYRVGNTNWQYIEGEQPEGAVEVDEKSKTPANKARTSANKAVEPDTK
ncbi:hypothetical protein E9228_002951 [Curtobacterium flaccumfaciens]|uniref:Uncharacterized protein n=1 Tax=Curtobacterium salicis TaxID=1779862 RepID=A0ABX0TBL0_9MICO|nr:hypothetical protein [Curtobacterium sp. WW7]NII42293.1 hypothetical protein [Curtobacterium sp. WW7]